MDFKSYLKETADQINLQLADFLKKWIEEVERVSLKLTPLAKEFVKSCEGGKRIRGSLVKLGYEIASTTLVSGKEILKPAIAYEIFHTSILAHDDIIDQSDLRRGQPTLYKALGGDHHAISQTICLADLGFFLATKLIAESNFPEKKKNLGLAWFSKTTIDTALGEMLDVEKGDVLTIMKLKTAAYTISGPLQLGAILAGAEEKLLRVLEEFGENLGIAFQIQDDILGVFGDEKTLGKSVTSDIEEGKNTLLITEALKRANSRERQILKQYYGKGDLGDQGLEAVRKVFMETGSLDYSQQFGVKYVVKAKSIIPKITNDKIMISILTEMADFLVEREY